MNPRLRSSIVTMQNNGNNSFTESNMDTVVTENSSDRDKELVKKHLMPC